MLILDLPVDVVLNVFRFIDVDDIFRLREVCRQFKQLTHLQSVWHIVLRTHIIDKDLPFVYGSPSWINTLSSRALEKVVTRAILNRRNWVSESPHGIRQLAFQTADMARPPAQQSSTIKELKLFNRGSHPYLLSATLNIHTDPQTPPIVSIECWDIERVPFCVARRQGPWHGGVLFNADSSSPPSVAVKGPDDVQIFSLTTVQHSFHLTFTSVARLPAGVDRLITFSGNIILGLDRNERLFLFDTNRPTYRMELLSPSMPASAAFPIADDQLNIWCESIITDEYLIVLRSKYIAIYSLRSFRHGPPHPTSRTLTTPPVSYHVWQWHIDSGRIAHRVSHKQKRTEPTLNVVIRFASTFPWPTNVLNHYVFHPNEDYNRSLGVRPDNVPYDLSPLFIQTISAPLRLFAQSDMAIGDFGTVVWIDTHTEDYFLQAASGQRVVGRGLDGDSDTAQATTSGSVFNMHEGNGWHRLAVDERHSRIAIGMADGKITVLDFA